jgi:hypothetical protein
MNNLSIFRYAGVRDSSGQDDAGIILPGITETEGEPMPASIEIET